ncbi:MAG TPA: hypothetical protein ENK95_02050 [Campylobacterales bacterium]|nr:hypothetical protein [Campylobacterales bacterium]
MQNLPITQVIPEVQELLKSHNKLVLQAPPGAGKTTALPLALFLVPQFQLWNAYRRTNDKIKPI